jgi:hypothetical protein
MEREDRVTALTDEASNLAKKGYLPAVEVARKIGRSKRTVYNWIENEAVKGVRIGAHWYVLWQSVLDYYKSNDPDAVRLLGLK